MKLISEYLSLVKIEGMTPNYLKEILATNNHGEGIFSNKVTTVYPDNETIRFEYSNETVSLKCVSAYYETSEGKNALKHDKCYNIQNTLLGSSCGHGKCITCHYNASEQLVAGDLKKLTLKKTSKRKRSSMIDASIFD